MAIVCGRRRDDGIDVRVEIWGRDRVHWGPKSSFIYVDYL